jgi:hypothetical protein
MPFAPTSSASIASRAAASAALCFCAFNSAMRVSIGAVRWRIVSRNLTVCAFRSSSLSARSRSPCAVISSTIGCTRRCSRAWRVPKVAPSRVLNVA